MADYSFPEACEIIESGKPYSLHVVANAWRNFATACRVAASHTRGTSDEVTAQYGAPYRNFGARAVPIASWLDNIAMQADATADGLAAAGDIGSAVQWKKSETEFKYNQRVDEILGPYAYLSPAGTSSATGQHALQSAAQEAARVLNAEIDRWATAYAAFNPGDVPPAPVTNGGSGEPSSWSPVSSSDRVSAGLPAATEDWRYVAPPSARTEYPDSSVVGSEGGDFEGWVRNPHTGHLVDPSTGREFDPVSGRWIDPVTGQPFGEVTRYASRLEGLEGGVSTNRGLLGSITPALLASGAVGNLYGGALPPSLAVSNPAAAQLGAKAASDMAARAFAAQQLGLREAAQGGRPFVPPMQAGGIAPESGSPHRSRPRYLTESPSIWTGASSSTGTRAPSSQVVPPKPSGVSAQPGSPVPPAQAQSGSRDAYPPSTHAGLATDQQEEKHERRGWSVEDDIWSSGRSATRGVLGEED